MPVKDNNFGADEYHVNTTGDDYGYLKQLGLGDKSVERGRQKKSNNTDYNNFTKNSKPVLTYPQDLFMANQVNGVCFFVKIRNNSVAAQNSGGASGLAADRIATFEQTHSEMATQMNRSSAEQYNATLTGGQVIVGAAGAYAAGRGITAAIKNKGSLYEKAKAFGKGNIGTAALAAGAIAVAERQQNKNERGFDNEAGEFAGGTQFLNKVIQLHVPQSIISQYQADWNDTELGMAGILANKRFDQASLGDVGESAARGIIQGAASLPKAIGVDADLGAAIEATSRKTRNPYKEQLFKSMGFRSFAFQYVFNPRNQEEYDNVREIINTFKYHMHPDISPGQAFLIYPSEFNIEFYHAQEGNVKPNPHLPKISDCALKDVKVTYGPDGFFNTVAGTDGIPSEITMELNFTELEVLTANRIADGY